MLILRVLILSSLLSPLCSLASAQSRRERPKADHSKPEVETTSPSVIFWLIEKNKVISREIDKIAERIDLFAANAPYADTDNKTQLKLISNFSIREGGERVYSPQIGAKINLPNLQEKLQLRFTTYNEDTEDRGINESRYNSVANEKNYGTSLALFQELGDIAVEFRPRLEFTDRFETSYLFKFTSEADIGAFTIDPEIQLFARSDTGTGQFVSLNFDYSVNQENMVTLVNEEQYTDGDNTLTTNHGIRWDHILTKDTSQRTRLIFESNNRATYHLERYVLSSTVGHKLYNNVLHYSVTPLLIFEKEKSFHPATGLDFRFEIIF